MVASIDNLCKKIGYRFNDTELLRMALTHRSMQGENNERLEFLGDSLLNFIIAAALYYKYPLAKEGQLTRIRAELVRSETLAAIGREFSIGEHLNLGTGELKSGGRDRASILADTMEAIIAAVYLDAGFKECEKKVLIWFSDRLNQTSITHKKDAKTALQEYLQSKKIAVPSYIIVSTTGDTHNQIFHVECRIEHLDYIGQGSGTSRRRAEQEAAKQVLAYLKAI